MTPEDHDIIEALDRGQRVLELFFVAWCAVMGLSVAGVMVAAWAWG